MKGRQQILHIGLHKTGTTWFQKRFYPKVRNFKYIDREIVKDKILLPGLFQFDAQQIIEYFSGISENIIICEENLTTGIRGNFVLQRGLFERVSQAFPEARIVVFFRNQPEKIASTYCYYLKNNGGTFGFNKFIKFRHNNPYNQFNFKPENLLYHHFLELLFQFFPKEKVSIYLYEDFASDNRNFLSRFKKDMGFDVDLSSISFGRENERIRRGLIPVARFSNLFTRPSIHHRGVLIPIPFWTGINRRMLKSLNKMRIFGKSPSSMEIMGKETYEYFCEYYRESNRKLIDDFGLNDIIRFGYPV
jgi:hypothetical protein